MSDEGNMPKVSVGLPVYNGEDYLEAALDSILAQTFSDFELVISDNGSEDATPAICRRYAQADSRIVLHFHDRNMGGAWNFNFVFHESRGRYFKWACADDIMAPTFLERCAEVLDENRDVVLCYPKTIMIDEKGGNPTPFEDGMHLVSSSPAARFEQLIFRKVGKCNPSLGLIRREALAATRLTGAYPNSDQILLAELALLGKYYEFPDQLAYRRDHPGTSVRANPTVADKYMWIDPSNKSLLRLPALREFVEYMRCIASSPISTRDKLHCSRLACRKFRWERVRLWREFKESVGHLV